MITRADVPLALREPLSGTNHHIPAFISVFEDCALALCKTSAVFAFAGRLGRACGQDAALAIMRQDHERGEEEYGEGFC